MKKLRVAVMFGGRSAEHEISVITGLQAIQALDPSLYEILPIYGSAGGKWYTGEKLLDKTFYLSFSPDEVTEVHLLPDPSIRGFLDTSGKRIPVDCCLLAFHGQSVEDGCMQGVLELADLPYAGSGVAPSAIAMNKYLCKMLLKAHGIPVLPGILIRSHEAIASLEAVRDAILSKLHYPLFIKPNNLGSSIGLNTATNERELYEALAAVFKHDHEALIEPQVENLLEINISVLDQEPPIASVVEIPLSQKGKVLTFEDKYLAGGSKDSSRTAGMAGLTRVVDPEDLDPSIKEEATQLALQVFTLLDCSGVCRLDFMLDTVSGELSFNELNPIPGSLAFYLWEQSEPPLLYPDLLDRMIKQAIARNGKKRSLTRLLGFRALKS